MDQITPIELAARLAEKDKLFLLDVREPHEVQEVAIKGIRNIPLGELAERTAEVPRDKLVVTICRSGGRSGRAAEFLVEGGWKVVNLDGGMLAWQDAQQYSIRSVA